MKSPADLITTEERVTERPDATEESVRERQNLERSWYSPSGPFGWLSHVNHQSIGKRYIVTAFVFFRPKASVQARKASSNKPPPDTMAGA